MGAACCSPPKTKAPEETEEKRFANQAEAAFSKHSVRGEKLSFCFSRARFEIRPSTEDRTGIVTPSDIARFAVAWDAFDGAKTKTLPIGMLALFVKSLSPPLGPPNGSSTAHIESFVEELARGLGSENAVVGDEETFCCLVQMANRRGLGANSGPDDEAVITQAIAQQREMFVSIQATDKLDQNVPIEANARSFSRCVVTFGCPGDDNCCVRQGFAASKIHAPARARSASKRSSANEAAADGSEHGTHCHAVTGGAPDC